MLEVVQADHEADGHAGPSHRVDIQCAKLCEGGGPIDLTGQLDQRMLWIKHVDQCALRLGRIVLEFNLFRGHDFTRFRREAILFLVISNPASSPLTRVVIDVARYFRDDYVLRKPKPRADLIASQGKSDSGAKRK